MSQKFKIGKYNPLICRHYPLNITPPARYLDSRPGERSGDYYYKIDRDLSEKELMNTDMELMPGFSLRWSFNVDLSQNETKFPDKKNIEFSR